jgi:hypothetical protein
MLRISCSSGRARVRHRPDDGVLASQRLCKIRWCPLCGPAGRIPRQALHLGTDRPAVFGCYGQPLRRARRCGSDGLGYLSYLQARCGLQAHHLPKRLDTLAEVRPAPFAAHMVDGVYYGRGEKKRIRLSDPQVRRYPAQRQLVEERMHGLLEAEIARYPVPAEVRKLGHLYLVAVWELQ